MPDPQIEKLLIVQDRDVNLQKIEQELIRVPRERDILKKKILAEEANVELARTELKNKEVARNELDSQVKSQEAAIQKYRTMQLEVKKNEEYRALTQQIEQAEVLIADLEDREIKLMLEIDAEKETFAGAKAEIDTRIKAQNALVVQLDERNKNLIDSLDAAKEATKRARVDVDNLYLEHYDRVRVLCKRPPYVAQIIDHQCSGCHLRVSNEVARLVHNVGEAHFCDQCGRMVFI
jgi:predicted  nucleic acid-binding Zn-ribbon protein